MTETLFRLGWFHLASGQISAWKIECDALTEQDWQTLAVIAVERLPSFGSVEGVPTGGERFAAALRPLATSGPLLIADDVLTTGQSWLHHCGGRRAIGVVAFARGPCPPWITAIFQISPAYSKHQEVGHD